MAAITGEWQKVLTPEFAKPYYRDLYNFVRKEYSERVIFPPSEDIFNALKTGGTAGSFHWKYVNAEPISKRTGK